MPWESFGALALNEKKGERKLTVDFGGAPWSSPASSPDKAAAWWPSSIRGRLRHRSRRSQLRETKRFLLSAQINWCGQNYHWLLLVVKRSSLDLHWTRCEASRAAVFSVQMRRPSIKSLFICNENKYLEESKTSPESHDALKLVKGPAVCIFFLEGPPDWVLSGVYCYIHIWEWFKRVGNPNTFMEYRLDLQSICIVSKH